MTFSIIDKLKIKFLNDFKAFETYKKALYRNESVNPPTDNEIERQEKFTEKVREICGLRDDDLVNEYMKVFNNIERLVNIQPAGDKDLYYLLRYKNAGGDLPGLTIAFESEQVPEYDIHTATGCADNLGYNNTTHTGKAIVEEVLRKAMSDAPALDKNVKDFNSVYVNIAAHKIAMETRRGAGNVIVTSKENADKLLKNTFHSFSRKAMINSNMIHRTVNGLPTREDDYFKYEYTIGHIRVYSSNLYDYIRTENRDDAEFLILYNGVTGVDGPYHVSIKSLMKRENRDTTSLINEWKVLPFVPTKEGEGIAEGSQFDPKDINVSNYLRMIEI